MDDQDNVSSIEHEFDIALCDVNNVIARCYKIGMLIAHKKKSMVDIISSLECAQGLLEIQMEWGKKED